MADCGRTLHLLAGDAWQRGDRQRCDQYRPDSQVRRGRRSGCDAGLLCDGGLSVAASAPQNARAVLHDAEIAHVAAPDRRSLGLWHDILSKLAAGMTQSATDSDLQEEKTRSEESRVGKECVSTCRCWGSPYQ